MATLAALAAGCAKEEPPPGALPDQRPPEVREIVPAPGSVVPDFDGAVRVVLDEPAQFSGGYGRGLEASPAYRYRVETGFSDIRVRPEGGWRRGVVYSFLLPGGFRDLLGNERREPIAVVFSTGPELTETRVTGRIRDRITGQGVRGARLLVLPEEGDSIPYTAVSDTGGAVSLRSLPPGAYRAFAFRDLNANRSLDRRLEAHDSASVRLEGPTASVELSFGMVPPDTTAPVLARVETVDSLTVMLAFDDPLDPEQDFGAAEVAVRPATGGAELPLERVGLTPAPREEPPAVPPPGDTAAADTADVDGAAVDTAPVDAAPPPDDTAAAVAAPADTLPLPSDRLFLSLGRPLRDGRTYRASAAGLRNLRGLAGGGDTTFVYVRPDPAADAEAPSDTAGTVDPAVPDTTGGERRR